MAAPIGRRQALKAVLVGVPIAAALTRAGKASAAMPVGRLASPPLGGPDTAAAFPAEEAFPPAARAEESAPKGEPAEASDGPLPELVPGLRIGSCTVVKVGGVVAGGVPVLLRAPDGTQFGVDILRHDRRAPGVARGGRLAVYLNNGGKGKTSSVETHGLGAMALANWLRRREARGCSVPALLTLKQRVPLLAKIQA